MRAPYWFVGATVCLNLAGPVSGVSQRRTARHTTAAETRGSGATRADIRRRLDGLVGNLHDRGLFNGAVVVAIGRDVVSSNLDERWGKRAR